GDASPGTLHTGNVTFGANSSTFAVRLNNVSSYDQLQAGNVDLTQHPNLSPTLPLPPPAVGDTFTILTGTINGTFDNHPNNDVFLINGYLFQITYTVNSVVLRRVAPDQPLTPGTGLTVNASEGSSFSGLVATFTDADSQAVASNFTATIDWGGTTSAGTIT